MSDCRLLHHSLKVNDAQASLDFYCQRLGMKVVGHTESTARSPSSYLLSFDQPGNSSLELLYDGYNSPTEYEHDAGDLYWKTGINVPDLNIARERLYFSGVSISEPRQFRDIAYLCHFKDPDGYIIELLQHRHALNHEPMEPDPSIALGTQPTLGHVTIRTRNPAVSVPFYRDLLGMQLLSRQAVDEPGFTLYFLGYTDELPPGGDIDGPANREWLWQRPYTMIELQHFWGTEKDPDFAYHTDQDGPLGFRGITIAARDRNAILRRARTFTFNVATPARGELTSSEQLFVMRDPDGTTVRIVEG